MQLKKCGKLSLTHQFVHQAAINIVYFDLAKGMTMCIMASLVLRGFIRIQNWNSPPPNRGFTVKRLLAIEKQ